MTPTQTTTKSPALAALMPLLFVVLWSTGFIGAKKLEAYGREILRVLESAEG